jgi:hypothetical protein
MMQFDMASTVINTPAQAQQLLESFVARHPGCTVGAQHFRQGTNSVVFRVKFKYFPRFYNDRVR